MVVEERTSQQNPATKKRLSEIVCICGESIPVEADGMTAHCMCGCSYSIEDTERGSYTLLMSDQDLEAYLAREAAF